jgi:hypothetical protein
LLSQLDTLVFCQGPEGLYRSDEIATSTGPTTFQNVSLNYAQPKIIFFAASLDLGTNDFAPMSPGQTGGAAVDLMLFGNIGNATKRSIDRSSKPRRTISHEKQVGLVCRLIAV